MFCHCYWSFSEKLQSLGKYIQVGTISNVIIYPDLIICVLLMYTFIFIVGIRLIKLVYS